MRTRNHAEIVLLVEFGADVAAKCVSSTARRRAPTAAVVRVRPQKIAHASFVAVKTLPECDTGYAVHFHHAIELADLIQRRDGG